MDARESEPHTVLKQIIKEHNGSLLGGTSTAEAEISQWLSFSRSVVQASSSKQELQRLVSILNSMLACRSFLIGNSITLADIAVAQSVCSVKLSKYPEVLRWLMHILAFCPGAPPLPAMGAQSSAPILFPVIRSSPESTVSTVGEKKAKKSAPVEAASEETKQGPEGASKEKKAKKDKKATVTATAAPSAEADSSSNDDADPSKLDFRVGYVVKCWEHPEAEKLLCEEIDIGEASGVRKIASGLRAFYSAEEVQGRKVIVLANLKDRNLVGFKSQVRVVCVCGVVGPNRGAMDVGQGMVICASNADHTVVKLLEPPEGANVGDRVVFDGFEGREPASASQVAKKKILEKLAPNVSPGYTLHFMSPLSIYIFSNMHCDNFDTFWCLFDGTVQDFF